MKKRRRKKAARLYIYFPYREISKNKSVLRYDGLVFMPFGVYDSMAYGVLSNTPSLCKQKRFFCLTWRYLFKFFMVNILIKPSGKSLTLLLYILLTNNLVSEIGGKSKGLMNNAMI